MRRIAEQCGRPPAPGRERRAIEQRPFVPMLCGTKKSACGHMPLLRAETVEHFAAQRRNVPAGLLPAGASDRDHIDQRSALYRVMYQMRVAAEPEIDGGLREFGRRGCGGHERAPGGMAGKPGLTQRAETLA